MGVTPTPLAAWDDSHRENHPLRLANHSGVPAGYPRGDSRLAVAALLRCVGGPRSGFLRELADYLEAWVTPRPEPARKSAADAAAAGVAAAVLPHTVGRGLGRLFGDLHRADPARWEWLRDPIVGHHQLYESVAAAACGEPTRKRLKMLVRLALNASHPPRPPEEFLHDAAAAAALRDALDPGPLWPREYRSAPARGAITPYLTDAARTLARVIWDCRDFAALPVLADALEDGGGHDPGLLHHLRRPGGHHRGCWALRRVLPELRLAFPPPGTPLPGQAAAAAPTQPPPDGVTE